MIYTPPIFTPMHQGEIDVEVPVHEELLRKMIANLNYLGVLCPIGTVIFVSVNNSGVVIPNANVWQECNGSMITHPDSPLRSIGANERFTPNLQNRYVRCAPNITTNPMAGSQTFDLSHDHGGVTGVDDPPPSILYEEDGNRRIREVHTHSIAADLGSPITVDAPKWIKLVAYMKIA